MSSQGNPVPPNPPPEDPGERTPFQRFEDLTRRLLSVPKSEIDERRKRSR